MTLERKSPGWEIWERYGRISELSGMYLRSFMRSGINSASKLRADIQQFSSFKIDEDIKDLKEEITTLKSNLKLGSHAENCTVEMMITIMRSFEALIEKADKLEKEQEAKCEKEDRAIALAELLAQMQEAQDELPDFVDPKKLAAYFQS